MRNAQSLIMLFFAAAFAVTLYAAETPEVKYDETRAVQLYDNGDCDNAFQLFSKAAAQGDATHAERHRVSGDHSAGADDGATAVGVGSGDDQRAHVQDG